MNLNRLLKKQGHHSQREFWIARRRIPIKTIRVGRSVVIAFADGAAERFIRTIGAD